MSNKKVDDLGQLYWDRRYPQVVFLLVEYLAFYISYETNLLQNVFSDKISSFYILRPEEVQLTEKKFNLTKQTPIENKMGKKHL